MSNSRFNNRCHLPVCFASFFTKKCRYNLKNYFTNFKHPIYKQLSEPFIPKMSTIDLLLNYDLKTSKKIIRGSGIIGE